MMQDKITKDTYDVIAVGAGIGGLTEAGLCAKPDLDERISGKGLPPG